MQISFFCICLDNVGGDYMVTENTMQDQMNNSLLNPFMQELYAFELHIIDNCAFSSQNCTKVVFLFGSISAHLISVFDAAKI